LTESELAQAYRLFRVELVASRQSVCQAMAFCFEKTAAAHQVASLLKDLFAVEGATAPDTSVRRPPAIGVETLMSRLYLLSDVLFNSQQSNVKHAFLYRSAIESMAPEIFSALGSYSRRQQSMGRRWTRHHKLATCVHVVLAAWSVWNVYPPLFLQDLQALFDGREVGAGAEPDDDVGLGGQHRDGHPDDHESEASPAPAVPEPVIREVAQGRWTTVEETIQEESLTEQRTHSHYQSEVAGVETGTGRPGVDGGPDGDPLDNEDPDGMPLEEDPDGVPLGDDPDGAPLDDDDDDTDGAPLDDDDPDGEPIDDS
jgi:U2-associated protein SR140